MATLNWDLFEGLAEDDVKRILALGSSRTVPQGTVLFGLGDEAIDLFLVESGAVKLTLPLIHALKNTNPVQRRKILRLIRHHNKNTSRVNEVIRFVRDNKGMEYSKEKMHEYKNKALDILNNFPESEARLSLEKLALYTASRDK